MEEEKKSLLSLKKYFKHNHLLKEIGLPRLLIILVTGLFLLVLSFSDMFGNNDNNNPVGSTINNDVTKKSESAEDLTLYSENLQERVKNILAKVEGIGAVDVMITLKSSKEQVTLKDNPTSQETTKETDSTGGQRENSKIQTDESSVYIKKETGEQVPYVTKELEPTIEGVVVIAEGGDNSKVINEIMDAIEVLFSVPVHKIKVMKMGK